MKIRIEITVIGYEIHVLLEKNGRWVDEIEFHVEEVDEVVRAVSSFIRKSIENIAGKGHFRKYPRYDI